MRFDTLTFKFINRCYLKISDIATFIFPISGFCYLNVLVVVIVRVVKFNKVLSRDREDVCVLVSNIGELWT